MARAVGGGVYKGGASAVHGGQKSLAQVYLKKEKVVSMGGVCWTNVHQGKGGEGEQQQFKMVVKGSRRQ